MSSSNDTGNNNNNNGDSAGSGGGATLTTSSDDQDQSSSTISRTASSLAKKSETVTSVPKDKHSVSKRLQQELLSLMMSGEKGVSAFPDGDNLFKWIGTIQGPIGTV
jgi:hypothetical protein